MSVTQSYREEHKELVKQITEIAKLIEAGAGQNAKAITSKFRRFSAKLKIHLSIEDDLLYPALIKAGGKTQEMGQSFKDEMGGLKKVFDLFIAKWRGADKIEADPDSFTTEFNGILSALSARIEKEESELYALADNLADIFSR
jgi:hemerythrin-like domain-containing protein